MPDKILEKQFRQKPPKSNEIQRDDASIVAGANQEQLHQYQVPGQATGEARPEGTPGLGGRGGEKGARGGQR